MCIMDPDVSIIIVNYKTSDLIINCIKSLYEKTNDINYEIILVDNNSEPNFQKTISEGLSKVNIPNIYFINLKENVGFGRANNKGLNIAKGRNIFFLNPDTLLINNAIKILSDFLDTHQQVGACGGNLVDGDHQPTHSYKRILPGLLWDINELFNNKLLELIFGKKNLYYNNKRRPLKVSYITGADLMVKREVLKQVGSFCPEFFMYYEETDLCARIKKGGWDIYNIPSARIIHLESKSFKTSGPIQSEIKTKTLEESRIIYNKRNLKSWEITLSDFIYDIFLLSRIKMLKEGNKKKYYILRRKYFKGI